MTQVLGSKWNKIYEKAETLLRVANERYQPLEPLIRYLERQLLDLPQQNVTQYEIPGGLRSVSEDLRKIRDLNRDIETVKTDQIDKYVEGFEVLKLLDLEIQYEQLEQRFLELRYLETDVPDECLWK